MDKYFFNNAYIRDVENLCSNYWNDSYLDRLGKDYYMLDVFKIINYEDRLDNIIPFINNPVNKSTSDKLRRLVDITMLRLLPTLGYSDVYRFLCIHIYDYDVILKKSIKEREKIKYIKENISFSIATYYNKRNIGISEFAYCLDNMLYLVGHPRRSLCLTVSLLTAIELEIVKLYTEGVTSYSDITSKLGISRSTIKNHWSNINAKLGVRNRKLSIEKIKKLNILQDNDSYLTIEEYIGNDSKIKLIWSLLVSYILQRTTTK